MKSRRHLLFFAIAALAWLVPAAPAQAAGSVPKLLTKFQPVLVVHPGEELSPTVVESFVRDATLEVATGPTTWLPVDPDPTVDTLPTSSPPTWRLNQQPCFAGAPLGDLACYAAAASDEPGAAIYGRVVRDGKNIVLQYWVFFYDNLYRYPFLPLGAIWQSHEGDWEVVNVVLSNAKRPLTVGLSQHCNGETRPGSETERRDGHLTVYVALGSHANYFEPGLLPFDPACLPAAVSPSSSRPACRFRLTSPVSAPPTARSGSGSSRPRSNRWRPTRRAGSASRASGASSSTSALRRRSGRSRSGPRPWARPSTRSGRRRSRPWPPGGESNHLAGELLPD